jgi:hypothetical protein
LGKTGGKCGENGKTQKNGEKEMEDLGQSDL